MDDIKSASLASGTYSIPQGQNIDVGKSEYCKKEAVELTKGMRGEVRSRGSKKIKDWVIQFFQRILRENKKLNERKVIVEMILAIQGLKQTFCGNLKKIGSGFVLICAKIATVFRSKYENDRRLAKAIKKFRNDPEELKAMIDAGVKLSRGYYYEGYEYPDYRMCPPLVRAMRDLENYNLDEVDRFKELLDILIKGGANVGDTAYCNWEIGRDYYRRRSPLDLAVLPLIEEWRGSRSTTDAEKHKLGVVIKHIMEKGARYDACNATYNLKHGIHALIMFGLSDALKLILAQGYYFYQSDFYLIFRSGDLESVKAILDGMLDRRNFRRDISAFMRDLFAFECDNEFKNKVLDIVVGLLNRKNQLDYVFIQDLLDLAILQGFVFGAERLLSLFPGVIQLESDYIIDVMKRKRVRMPLESFDFMLKKGCDINCQDESGNTPLHLAAKESDIELLVFLLRNKACVDCLNYNGNTPFHLVSESMRKNWDDPDSRLDISYIKKKRKQSREMMEVLVRAGADLNAKNNEGYTPLLFLAEKDDYDTIDFLIMHGADPRKSQSSLTTPLHVACKNNNRELIDLFSKFKNLVVSQNVDGDTPLHLVLKQKNDKMDRWVRLLINSGADVNKANNAGETPKMLMHGIYDEKGFPVSRSLQQQAWRAVEVFYDEDTLKQYLTERNLTRFKDMFHTR